MRRFSVPSSKSISNRLLIIEQLSKNKEGRLINLSMAEDTLLMQRLIGELNQGNTNRFYCDNAGTVSRFIIGLLSITKGEYIVDGSQRLRQRPMKPLIETLRKLGVGINCLEREGYLPIEICSSGEIIGGEIEIDTNLSSQFLTSLLLIAPKFSKTSIFNLSGSNISLPYIEMSVELIREMGIDIEFKDNKIRVEPREYNLKDIIIEADWSSASFGYELAYITKEEAFIPNLKPNSIQGDSISKEYFSYFGIETIFNQDGGILIPKQETSIEDLEFNIGNCPDLFLPLAVCGALSKRRIVFKNTSTLKHKESNRIEAAIFNLNNLGFETIEEEDSLIISKKRKEINTKEINSYNDHRVAMAFGLLKLMDKEISVDNPECVKKSFPDFWENINIEIK